jgi:sec-independent protein translocase protein TatA
MGLSTTHLLLLLVVVVLLFGRGKVSELMGDVAKGIKSFKKGMAEDDVPPAPGAPKTIDQNGQPVNSPRDTAKTN